MDPSEFRYIGGDAPLDPALLARAHTGMNQDPMLLDHEMRVNYQKLREYVADLRRFGNTIRYVRESGRPVTPAVLEAYQQIKSIVHTRYVIAQRYYDTLRELSEWNAMN